MQTQNLQIPTLNANAAAAPRVNLNLQASAGENAFQRALSREMDQRQSSTPLASAAPRAAERPAQNRAMARPNEGGKPLAQSNNNANASQNSSASSASDKLASGNADAVAASNAAATTSQNSNADSDAAAATSDSSTAASASSAAPSASTAADQRSDLADSAATSDAQAAAQADPVAQMLALVAAFNQSALPPVASERSVDTSNASISSAVSAGPQSVQDALLAASSSASADDTAALAAWMNPATPATSVDPAKLANSPDAATLRSTSSAQASVTVSTDLAGNAASATPVTLGNDAQASQLGGAAEQAAASDFNNALIAAQSAASTTASSASVATPSTDPAATAATATAAALVDAQGQPAPTPGTPLSTRGSTSVNPGNATVAASGPDFTLSSQPASASDTALSQVAAPDEQNAGAPIKAVPTGVSSQPGAESASPKSAAPEAALTARTTPASETSTPLKDSAPAISVTSNAPTALAAAKAAVNAVPTEKLSGRVGTPAWDQQLGQKIVFMAAGGEQSATMELNPPDLGPLQVVLSINKDQATAAFTSAQPEVRQALEAALPKLKEMMSEAGIQLGNASVSAGMSDQGNAFSQQAGAAQNGSGGSGRSGSAAHAGTGSAGRDGSGSETPRSAAPRRLPAGAVDTFA